MIRQAIERIRPPWLILAFILIFFGKNSFPINGNFIGGLDIPEILFWNFQFVKDQFLSGSIPLWNPYYYCGHPFLANPPTSVFYPSTLLFLALPLPWAFNVDTLLHIFLAATGIYYFVFILTGSKSAGLAASIVYSLSGYCMDRIFAGHLLLIRSAALLPWIFYFIEKAFKTKQSRYFIISGLVLGVEILNGNSQGSLYTGLFLTVYFFIRYFLTPENHRIGPFRKLCIYYLLIPAVAIGVSAIQIIPSVEFFLYSDRAKNTYEFATFYSFPPQNFFTFVVPKPRTALLDTNWEFGAYLGILSVVLAGIGGVLSKQRQYTFCFWVMLSIAVTIMLGHYTPIYQLYYKFLPGISAFRIPARCLVIFVFSTSVFAGFGVQRLCNSPLTKKQYSIIMVGLIILFLCLLGGAKAFRIPFASKEILLATGLTISASAILSLTRFLKNKHIIVSLIITAIFIDLYVVYSPQIPRLNQNELTKKRDYEFVFEQDHGFYRVNLPFGTLRGSKFHYYDVNGFTNAAIKDYYQFIHDMANIPRLEFKRHTINPQLFQPELVFSSKILGIKYAIVQGRTGYQLIKARQVMPRAVLVRDAIVLPQLDEQLRYMKRADFDPQKQVLLEGSASHYTPSVLNAEHESTKDDSVKIIQYFPNRIELESNSGSNAYLVLSELFYPGWHAYINGKEIPILRADYVLRAIPLTPGRHTIVFVYRPMSFIIGAALSAFTLLLLGGIFIVYYRKQTTP